MKSMFSNCSRLTSLNLSNFNTNNVQDMDNMFYYIQKNCNVIYDDIKIKNELNKTEYIGFFMSKLSKFFKIIGH